MDFGSLWLFFYDDPDVNSFSVTSPVSTFNATGSVEVTGTFDVTAPVAKVEFNEVTAVVPEVPRPRARPRVFLVISGTFSVEAPAPVVEFIGKVVPRPVTGTVEVTVPVSRVSLAGSVTPLVVISGTMSVEAPVAQVSMQGDSINYIQLALARQRLEEDELLLLDLEAA